MDKCHITESVSVQMLNTDIQVHMYTLPKFKDQPLGSNGLCLEKSLVTYLTACYAALGHVKSGILADFENVLLTTLSKLCSIRVYL